VIGRDPAGSGPARSDSRWANRPSWRRSRGLHVLNRLNFGPASGEVSRVQQIGVGHYIDASTSNSIRCSSSCRRRRSASSLHSARPLCANMQGFSLHAAVRCAADRGSLEQAVPLHHPPGTGQRTRAMRRLGPVPPKLKTPGATARRARRCRRWSSCSGLPRWLHDSASLPLGCWRDARASDCFATTNPGQ
jgi:hypothetical protein